MKYNEYRTIDGDRIDIIVATHYGDLSHLNDVVFENKLFNKSIILDGGLTLKLPIYEDTKIEKISDNEDELLW